jgi:hypothetical protein
MKKIILALVLILPLAADTSNFSRSVGQVTLPEGLSAVPTSLTAVSSVDSWIFQITVNNSTSGSVTFTVQDQQGTPQQLVGETIPANTVQIISFPSGVKMIGGIKWVAGATGVISEIFGSHK